MSITTSLICNYLINNQQEDFRFNTLAAKLVKAYPNSVNQRRIVMIRELINWFESLKQRNFAKLKDINYDTDELKLLESMIDNIPIDLYPIAEKYEDMVYELRNNKGNII
jgi:hypothetical protein